MDEERLDAHLRLSLVAGLGPVLVRRLIDALGSAEAVSAATPAELQRVEGVGRQLAQRIRRGLDEADPQAERSLMDRHGVRAVGIDDPEYPPLLRHIHDPPFLLYVRGAFRREDALALAIVGTRRSTAYGREQADRMAALCAQQGLTIVSGGARGIDSAAHRAALRVRGRTVAVLGCGLSQCYPAENADLFAQIADGPEPVGAVVSELPMTTPPTSENFPRRNRIISALTLGVLVVEATAKSGALITARLAVEEHNREVMALPGRVDSPASAGCHRLLQEGAAHLVTNPADVFDALGEVGTTLRAVNDESGAEEPSGEEEAEQTDWVEASLTENQRAILSAITDEPVSIDGVCRQTGLAMAVLQAEVTQLQLRGLVERVAGNQLRRR